jgi:pimeloyl-ACP methyl ester carboxylesterase
MIRQLGWLRGFRESTRRAGLVPNAQVASYSLNDLAQRDLLPHSAVTGMLLDSGLYDFNWHMVWGDDHPTPAEELESRIGDVDGYVVFMHGWTGSNAIWEDLPGLVVAKNPRLVALVVDHNGFGETPFVDPTPDFEHCSPIGAMRAIERWFDLLHLRRQPGDPKSKTVNFVGHSMGGAALFFLDVPKWNIGEQTRTAIAPALLLHDEVHRAFYTALGLGIGLVGRLHILESIEDIVEPHLLEVLTDGASQAVIQEHYRIYEATPRSVTARTFAAMGVIKDQPPLLSWDHMRVVLGHRDVLVGLIPMMDLLQELNFRVDQVRVVMGTHYLFSLGDDMRRVHEQNRQIVLEDILTLHEQALRRQKTG